MGFNSSGYVPNFNGGGGGGGITELLLGRTNYVSSAGGSGLYQHLENHYTNINAAVTGLGSDNDLVVVLPGSYTLSSATFQNTLNIFLYPGAELTIDSALVATGLQTLNIAGMGDVIFEDLNKTIFVDLNNININCNSCSFIASDIDLVDCNVRINCTGNCIFSNTFSFLTASGKVYNEFTINASRIEFNLGCVWDESNYSVHLAAQTKIIEGYIIITNTSNKLFNFTIDGDLFHEIVTNQPAVSIAGNAWFNTSQNFVGYQHNGYIRCKINEPAMILYGARVKIINGIKHEIQNTATFPDVPSILIDSSGNSEVSIDTNLDIVNFNSDGTSGIIYCNNDGATHLIMAQGKFVNNSINGDVFVAITPTQQLILGHVWSNLNITGANTNIQSQGATNTDPDII